jgi:hypothetical protein
MYPMIRMKLLFCLTLGLALTLSAPAAATAQHHPPPLQSGRSQGFYVTSFSAVSPDSGKRRVVVAYRLPRNFLVFTRDEGGSSTFGYTARCDVSFELRDAKGTPVVQRLTTRTFRSGDNAEHSPDTLSYSGDLISMLFGGVYGALRGDRRRIEAYVRTIRSPSPCPGTLPTVALSGLLLQPGNRTRSATASRR